MRRMFGSAQELWIWLSLACGPASNCVSGLIGYFGDIRNIYSADEVKLRECFKAANMRVQQTTIDKLIDKDLKNAREIVRYCKRLNIGIISIGDAFYPRQLGKLKNLPAVLYYVGTIPDTVNNFTMAVVGTRKMTQYGKSAAYNITYKLAKAGTIVVSGLAKGIDGTAAAATLDASGTTIAVLGSGIDVMYPCEHDILYAAIARKGMIISEFSPSTMPEGRNFPIRNRLIAGLARATLVVEGDTASGALITARDAMAQKRDLFAVPGPVNSQSSAGPNSLIRDGATVALSAADILEPYRDKFPQTLNIFKAWKQDDFSPEYIDERLKLWRIASTPVSAYNEATRKVVGERDAAQKSPQRKGEVKQYVRVNGEDIPEETDAAGTSFVAPASIINYINKTLYNREKPPRTEIIPASELSATVAKISETPECEKSSTDELVEAVSDLHQPFEHLTEQEQQSIEIPDENKTEAENIGEPPAETDAATDALIADMTDEERSVYELLKPGEPTNADMLAKYGVTASDACSIMTLLSLRGILKEQPGNYFIR